MSCSLHNPFGSLNPWGQLRQAGSSSRRATQLCVFVARGRSSYPLRCVDDSSVVPELQGPQHGTPNGQQQMGSHLLRGRKSKPELVKLGNRAATGESGIGHPAPILTGVAKDTTLAPCSEVRPPRAIVSETKLGSRAFY